MVWHDVVVVDELVMTDCAFPFCSQTFYFRSLRISAGDRSSRYPLGWCGSSTRQRWAAGGARDGL